MATDATPLSIAKVGLSNVVPGWLTMLQGDPNAETTLGRYIPGGVQGLVGGVGGFAVDMANLLGREIPKGLGYDTGLPPVQTPEFVQLAQQHHAGAEAAADAALPGMLQPIAAENAPERVARDVVRGVTELGFGVPGLRTALRYAPGAIRAGAEMLMPAGVHPVGVGAPAAATVGALSTYNEANQPEGTTPRPQFELGDVSAPTTPGNRPQFELSSGGEQANKPQFELGGAGATPSVTEPTPQPHDTSNSWAHAIELGGAILGGALAHRPISSLWGRVTEAKRQVEYDAQRNAVGLATADPAAIKPPGYDPTQPVEVPQIQLPGDTGLGTTIKTAFVDENARAAQTMAAYADTPEEAKAVKRIYGQINDRLSAQNREREFIETGMVPTTKTQLPALGSYARRYARIGREDPELKAKINQTAQYGNELNDRDIMFRKALSEGPISEDDTTLRHSFWEIPTSEMRAQVAANKNDPTVRAYIDEYNATKREYLQHAVDRGLITQQTADNLISLHPDHISRVDPTGRIVDLLGPRELTTRGGPNIVSQDFVETMMDQLPQLIRSAEKNDSTRMLFETFMNGQRTKPHLPTVITEIPERGPGSAPIKDDQRRIVHVGYGTGARSFEVHDARLYNLITKGNDFLGPALQGVAHATQMLQSFTTGVGALAVPRLFGLMTNLPRNIIAGSTQRPKGMAGGITDKLLQSATGGRVGLRVADPLSIVGSAYELAAGSAAMFTKGMANILERNQASGARLIRAFLGEQGTRNMIDAMNNAYAKSNLSQSRAEGAAGAGQGSRSRVEALGNTLPRGLSRSEISAALKKPYVAAQTNVPELYHGRGVAFAVRSRAMLNDFNNLMNDAYHLHVRRLNPKMDTLERAYEVNQLVGAPGQTGGNKSFRNYASLVPYLNPSIQGTARALRSYNEAPLGTAFGKLATHTMILAAERWLSMQGSPDHQNILDNILTTRQLAGNAILQFDPINGLNFSKLPFPQEDWFMIPAIREAIRHITSAWQADQDGNYRDWIINGMGQWFHSYMTPKQSEGMLYGVAQLVDPVLQLPAGVNALVNALGVRYRGDTANLVSGLTAGRPLLGVGSPLVSNITDPYHLPSQDLSREGGDIGILNAMLASVFGAMYTTVSGIYGEMQHAQTFGEFLKGTTDVLQERFRSTNALGGGLLYPGAPTISPRGSSEQQYVTNTIHSLKETEGLTTTDRNLGMTRPGGEGIAIRGDIKTVTDPAMQQLLVQATALHKYLGDMQKQVNDIDKLRQSAQALHTTQDDRRLLLNDYAREERSLYINAQEVIDKANEQATAMVGGPVDFAKKINWQGSIVQFADGSPSRGPQFDLGR